MLTLSGIRKSYGGRVLFEDAGLQVNRGDRLGLVGPNGAGKSTLFSLILGEEQPDAGAIALVRGTTFGLLPQESAPAGDDTVLALAAAVTPELGRLHRRLTEIDHLHATGHTDDHPHDEAEVRREFDRLGGHGIVARAKQILHGLGFRDADHARPAVEMSGGWVMRAHLARLLVQEPDLLLLDEPTNHLDLEALLWFQEYLKTYPGGILVISHDREFLNQLVDSVIEIRQSKLLRYRGNYDAFLSQRASSTEQHLAAWKNQQREIARLQRFVDRFGAKNTKASQAQSKLKQIERMEKIEAPEGTDATVDFHFPQPARSGLKVVRLENVQFAYPPRQPGGAPRPIYQSVDFEAQRGQRIVLVGPNGAGKSTLLKLLAGVLAPDAGERRLGQSVKSGYYSQYRIDMLHPDRTVLDEALDTPQAVTELTVRTLLGSFLFRGDDVFKRVEVLSGGEKSRLALVKLLLDPPNLLLMDEPTTHLDLPSTDTLIDALDQFEGTLIFISHDVHFIRHLANHVVHVQDGRLTPYPGDYQYYLDKTNAAAALAAAVAASRRPAAPVAVETPATRDKARKRLEAEQRQARARARRAQQQVVEQLEQAIHTLETRQAELTHALEDPATYEQPGLASEINREFVDLRDRLEQLTRDWETAAHQLTALDTPGS